MRGWSRISPGICEAGSAVTQGRGAEQMAHRLLGSSAQKAASATECKECQRSVAGVSHCQDLLEDRPDQNSAFAQGRQSRAIKGGSTSVPQIVLSFFIEKMRKERKCAAVLFTDIKAAFYSVFAEIALGGLLPLDTREQLFDKAGLSGHIRQVLRDLLAEDAVVTAQCLDTVWRRAAQDCSFGVKGNERWTMLWSGTRSGDTMADLIFCLAFARLQVTLEERL